MRFPRLRLMPERPSGRIPQCSDCGRVRVGRVWKWDYGVKPACVGFCPACLAWQTAMNRLVSMREERRMLARRKRGFGPAKSDPFEGMRGEK